MRGSSSPPGTLNCIISDAFTSCASCIIHYSVGRSHRAARHSDDVAWSNVISCLSHTISAYLKGLPHRIQGDAACSDPWQPCPHPAALCEIVQRFSQHHSYGRLQIEARCVGVF